eukprot:1146440-Pelagomonas_calceolata.AAC.2
MYGVHQLGGSGFGSQIRLGLTLDPFGGNQKGGSFLNARGQTARVNFFLSFKGLSSSHPPYHYVRCGWGHLHPPHCGAPKLDLDTHAATKLALNLHAHFVQYAYTLASTRRALEKTSFTSHRQDQAQATASNPPDPH